MNPVCIQVVCGTNNQELNQRASTAATAPLPTRNEEFTAPRMTLLQGNPWLAHTGLPCTPGSDSRQESSSSSPVPGPHPKVRLTTPLLQKFFLFEMGALLCYVGWSWTPGLSDPRASSSQVTGTTGRYHGAWFGFFFFFLYF
jgi:hypothetical protein